MTTYTQPKPPGTPTWVDLLTPDAEAARSFYRAVFGWDYDIGGPEFGGYTIARLGPRAAAGIVGPQPDMPQAPAAWGLYFATEAIEADVARAVQLGAKVLSPAMAIGEFGSMATCEDPTGAAFSFWQAGQHIGAQVANEPGATAWFELYSPNAAQARDFYAALLGAGADLTPGGLEYYVLKHGEDMLAGIMQLDPSWGAVTPQWIAYFGVANADDAVATATHHGGAAMGDIDDSPFGRIAALKDPSGAAFKIVEVPAP